MGFYTFSGEKKLDQTVDVGYNLEILSLNLSTGTFNADLSYSIVRGEP